MQTAGSSNTSTKVRNDGHRPLSSFSGVTSGTPAKRITFFKSGDAQFTGVRMAIHKRSFKCFDALLDDLSQKVPLPFGVRTITTPRGIHSVHRLEQLEDGGCYLCSDRRYVKPIDLEAAGKRPTVWHHSHPHNTRKKPSRPEEPPTSSGQHYHRHPKRILLVKNNDPAVRRSIILSRRMARSLRVFLDEISELMQYHVRKLYTLDGRKIDSIQSLMQCPSVLVCVGREPFKPLMMEHLRKHSEEKLPGMGTRSRSSTCSEGHESKKNVNFGLETKKSIIHPRSDSSNRSTRFSLSSEKSYSNGLCLTPGQSASVSTCPYTKEVILNDDIEKRVLVNKDGSLSVEMKVRFRLVNDETLQWSTEIKKSAITLNESSSVKDGDAHCLQSKTEYSDPECNSACEAEEDCTPLHQKHIQESHCQNCCNQCHEYDIWKNPMHKHSGDNRARNSSSSSCSSHKIMRKKASVDSIRTISRSSEEYTEHVVEKASCFQQTVEEGDTRVEYCSISRCCSHSEVSGTATKLKSKSLNENTCEANIFNICHHNDDKNLSATIENILSDPGSFEVPKVTEDRPISAVSSSSKVLESLKEDEDDDYDDLPPSASRASEWSQGDNHKQESQFACVHCYGSQTSQNCHLSPRPPSKVSSCSTHSSKPKKYRGVYTTPDSATSSVSKVSSRPPSCHDGATTPGSMVSDMQDGLNERIPTPKSNKVSNKAKLRTDSPSAAVSEMHGAQEECEKVLESGDRPGSAMSENTLNSIVCPYCGGCERSLTAVVRPSGNTQDTKAQDAEITSIGGKFSKSNRSEASAKSERSNKCTQGDYPVSDVLENNKPVQTNLAEVEDKEGHSESALSGISNPSATSKQSNKSNHTAHRRSSTSEALISENAQVEKRTRSAMSVKSNASAKSNTKCVIQDEPSPVLDNQKVTICQDVRAISPMSDKSDRSSKSRSSHKSCSHSDRTTIPKVNDLNDSDKTLQNKDSERRDCPGLTASASNGQEPETVQQLRVDSAMSMTSDSSLKHPSSVLGETRRSGISQNQAMENAGSPAPEERIPSAMSDKAHSSKGSHRFHKSDNIPDSSTTSQANDTSLVTKNFPGSINKERPTSAFCNVSASSDACSERASKLRLKATVQATEDTMGSTQNSLTVNSPSPKKSKRVSALTTPKSPVNTGNKDRVTSGMSVKSKGSTKSTRSKCNGSSASNLKEENSKIHSENDECVKEGPNSLSEKSPTPSPYGQLDEPLSPTSTASVSLGLGEEEKSEVFSERSINSMSQNLEQGDCPLERPTPEPAESNHDIDSSEKVKTKDRAKTATPMSRAVSKNSKRSPMSHGECNSSERAVSPASVGKPGSSVSTKSKVESVDSHPSENKSAMKGSKDAPPAVFENIHDDEGQMDKSSTISVSSSKCSQNKNYGKSTSTGTVKCRHQGPAKLNKGSSSNLKIKETNITQDCETDTNSVKSSKSANRINKEEQTSRHTSVVKSDVPQNDADPTSEMPNINVMPVIHLESSNDSVLLHTLSAADLLREKVGNARPVSRGSGSNKSGKKCANEEVMDIDIICKKMCKSKQRKSSTSSQAKSEAQTKLMPFSLPNASPAEVINDWLKNIPIDGPMYEMENEFDEENNETAPQVVTVNEEKDESLQNVTSEIPENVIEMTESQEVDFAAVEDPVKEDNNVCNETQEYNELSKTNVVNTEPNCPLKSIKREGFPKRCHSSAQVMKVLLSSKLDRCNSLPEVSPVYGRKLSTSAKGLLDCLANLQLIDSDPKNSKGDKYNEIVSILQSLWMYDPYEIEQEKRNIIDQCSAEDEFNPRSSSGVDVSSGSIGSGKGSISGGIEKSETAHGRKVSITEQEDLQIQEGEVDPSSVMPETADTLHIPSDPLTPDIAERVQCSPEGEKLKEVQIDDDLLAKEEVIQRNENQNETNEAELSNKSFGNESNSFTTPADKKTDIPENTNSESSPPIQRGILTRRVSLDPDPVWVLSLLKKLEKQFMSHYANAIAEFKVKWDLDDSEMLDKMISELKEEVQKRIQSSINRELQKIQSRAGRTPRPPISALSRDSTIQTEQRRRRLKVMRNKSINTSLSRSEDMNTASGTEFSDQRSEDEYCPCDACLKKKMESRAVQRAEALSLAPVLQDFDLRRILQIKKGPPATMATDPKLEKPNNLNEGTNCSNVQNNLDVVHEESEVHHNLRSQTDEDKVEVEGPAESKDENSEENAVLVPKTHDAEVSLVSGEEENVRNASCEDGNEVEEENLEDQTMEDKGVEKDESVEEGDTETGRDKEEGASQEQDTGHTETEEKGNSEHSENADINKVGETLEGASEDDKEEAAEIEETVEEGDLAEGVKEEEAELDLNVNVPGDKSEEPENEVEAEHCKNETAETTNGEEKNEDDTINYGAGVPSTEDQVDENQDASSQDHVEPKDEAVEDEVKDEDAEQAEGSNVRTDEKHQDEMAADDAKNQAETPDYNSEKEDKFKKDCSPEVLGSGGNEADASRQNCEEDFNHGLSKQITKTSIESQPGSMEFATDQKIKAKLKDIHSFMEGSESQEECIVVITKQSPFTERRRVSSRHGNKEEVENEVIEWQVSPKRRNRSPARANKQRRPKDSDVKVDDLEF